MSKDGYRSIKIDGASQLAMEEHAKAKATAVRNLIFADSFVLLASCPVGKFGNTVAAMMSADSAFLDIDPMVFVKELREAADKIEKAVKLEREREAKG